MNTKTQIFIIGKKKINKYLGVNLTKHVQDLYAENYIMLRGRKNQRSK